MPAPLNLSGQRFERLVVLERRGSKWGKSLWLCRCDCGGEALVTGNDLREARTSSCGCLRAESARRCGALADGTANIKHRGTLDHPAEYHVWKTMRQRCMNPRNQDFAEYGGRGITVCERWNDFANFIADIGQRPSSKHSIDRKNNQGNYEPSNCQWATATEQANNRRPRRTTESERGKFNQQEAEPCQ